MTNVGTHYEGDDCPGGHKGVTIPADTAKKIAHELRAQAARNCVPISAGVNDWTRWADVLDPPPPSLRDEIAGVYSLGETLGTGVADSVLAVVRRHVEALPRWFHEPDGLRALDRDDVLRLLGADDA